MRTRGAWRAFYRAFSVDAATRGPFLPQRKQFDWPLECDDDDELDLGLLIAAAVSLDVVAAEDIGESHQERVGHEIAPRPTGGGASAPAAMERAMQTV